MTTDQNIILLARSFSAAMMRHVSADSMREIIARNHDSNHSGACHSHDFTDANEVMAEAWADVGSLPELDTSTDAHCLLWNQAWNLAKRKDFMPCAF